MASIYDIKPAFQNLLRPLTRALAAMGVTANQVTLAAAPTAQTHGGPVPRRRKSPCPDSARAGARRRRRLTRIWSCRAAAGNSLQRSAVARFAAWR